MPSNCPFPLILFLMANLLSLTTGKTEDRKRFPQILAVIPVDDDYFQHWQRWGLEREGRRMSNLHGNIDGQTTNQHKYVHCD